MKIYKLIPILLCIACFTTGCGNDRTHNDMKNVEQRDYATILLVSEGEDSKYRYDLAVAQEKRMGEESRQEEVSSFEADNVKELEKEYELVKGKDLSLAHLKVILFEREPGVALNKMNALWMDMDSSEEIAKTCPVLQIKDMQEFTKYLEDAKEPVGTYIAELIRTNEGYGRDIPWLKDYLQMIREGKEIFIYELKSVPQGFTLSCVK